MELPQDLERFVCERRKVYRSRRESSGKFLFYTASEPCLPVGREVELMVEYLVAPPRGETSLRVHSLPRRLCRGGLYY